MNRRIAKITSRRMKKAHAPAAERNQRPILEVLRRTLPTRGTVLEIASGTGQHAEFFSEGLPLLTWQPSDCSPHALESIAARVHDANRSNFLPPVELDVLSEPWPISQADAVLCINMIHISPWAATEALFCGAGRTLALERPLVTYGPYRIHGVHTAPSNEAFDESLRSRNPEWGVRDIDDLVELAQRFGFVLTARDEMPANNMTLTWRRAAAGHEG